MLWVFDILLEKATNRFPHSYIATKAISKYFIKYFTIIHRETITKTIEWLVLT